MPDVADLRSALRGPVLAHDPEGFRLASVAAIFDEDLDLLFIRRAEYEGDPWSGQIGFPGGRRDPADADSLAAAIRETVEEVGLDLAGADLLGRLDDVLTPSGLPPMRVRPFVFQVERFGTLTLETREVAGIHTLGLQALLDGVGRGTFDFEIHGQTIRLPHIDFDGVRLWGMTLRVVDSLLDRLDGGNRLIWATTPLPGVHSR